MGLLGNSFDDPQTMGNLALAAGMIRGDLGGGLLGYGQSIQAAKQNALKQQYMNAQMADMQQQSALRQAQVDALLRKQRLIEGVLSGGGVPAASPNALPGQLGSGSFGAMSPPAGQPSIPMPQAPQTGGGFVSGLTPDKLALLKLGADADLTDIYKLTQPNMQVSNGYAYDQRTLKPGFLPQVNTSANGQTSLTMPDGQGGVRVMAPQGALDTYSSYRNADEAAKAGQDLVKAVSPDGSERYVTRAQAVRAAQPPAQPAPVRPMAMPGDADRFAILSQELAKAQASGNAGDVAAIQREMGRLPASARTSVNPDGLAVPLQASQTTQQAAQAAAEKERQVQITKDIGEQRKSIMNADFSAPTNIAKMKKIGDLLAGVDGGKFTPNGTEVASALNSLGIKGIDKNLGNKQAAAAMANEMALQLRSPQGGAGMPGALSDKDREFLSSMTPNQAQSLEGRNQVIGAYIAVQQRNQQIAQFARNYEKKYGKLDNGFFDQMAAWSAAHPLFGGK